MNLTTYREAKQRHPNMLLLFRAGDSYELYGEDAETAAKLLGLALTKRTPQGEKVLMADFPHHALEIHLHALLRAGQRVAVCDQVDEPTAPKSGSTLFDDMDDG